MTARPVPSARRVVGLVAALGLAATGGCSSDIGPADAPLVGTAASAKSPLVRVFDNIHRRYRYEMVGACMGAIDGDAHAVKCYGRLERGSSRHPTPRTLFQIGSISKTITATQLALYVRAGAVRFDDPLRRYIPQHDGSAHLPPSLTLLDLANHYSGFPRSTPVGHVSSVDQYLAAAGRCERTPGCPVGPPGGQYSYSNFAYGILGEALALNAGYPQSSYSAWEKDVSANVLGPLAMPDTRSGLGWRATSPAEFDARRARATVGDPPHEPRPLFFAPAPYGDAAAGLYSSTNDMLTWLSYSMGLSGTATLNAARPLLYDTPSLTRRREDPQDPHRKIGLAWRIDVGGSGQSRTVCISKNGEARGFTAHMVFFKHRRVGAFVLLNDVPEDPSSAAIATDLVNSLPSVSTGAPHAHRCVFDPN